MKGESGDPNAKPRFINITCGLGRPETCSELRDCLQYCTDTSVEVFNNGKAPDCFKARRKFISQVLLSGKGEGRQSNYLPRQEDKLCMSNQHFWMAEDLRHQPNLGPASFTCSGTHHTAQCTSLRLPAAGKGGCGTRPLLLTFICTQRTL